MIFTNNRQLSKSLLFVIATIGWALILHLCWRVLVDSWERTEFALEALAGHIGELHPFDGRYAVHPFQTLAHTISGMVFAVLGPIQFTPSVRNLFPAWHRISGRILLLIGLLSGTSALLMNFSFPVWGHGYNQVITAAWAAFMMFAFINAFVLVRKRKYSLHREWMMRGFATGLAVSVFRVINEELLAPMGYSFDDRWTILMLISLPITLGATELWIRATRPRSLATA